MGRARWGKSKTTTLRNYITGVNVGFRAISMASGGLAAILSKMDHRRVEVVTKSRLVLARLKSRQSWVLQTTADARRHAGKVRKEGVVAIT